MERREAAQALRDGAGSEAAAIAADSTAVTERRDGALAEIDEQGAKASAARAAAAGDVPADLQALYAKIGASAGGRGAALLRRGHCGGCREMLSTVELNAVRAAAPDEVVRHEECGRILIRTADSGL
jgi:predicted  nucleic acid-binding Zn-ribbon protein